MDLSEVERFEETKVGTLKLSAAIRAGIAMYPTKGYEYNDGCALCCAAAGMGFDAGAYYDQIKLDEAFPMLQRKAADPTGVLTPNIHTLRNVVSYLNGYHEGSDDPHWTRERIADWLEAQGL